MSRQASRWKQSGSQQKSDSTRVHKVRTRELLKASRKLPNERRGARRDSHARHNDKRRSRSSKRWRACPGTDKGSPLRSRRRCFVADMVGELDKLSKKCLPQGRQVRQCDESSGRGHIDLFTTCEDREVTLGSTSVKHQNEKDPLLDIAMPHCNISLVCGESPRRGCQGTTSMVRGT